jgi:hypothetical protein
MMHRTGSLLAVVALAGCPVLSERDEARRLDADGDTFPSADYGGTDCNDADPEVNPRAVEVCDGVDNDCNGLVNDADPGAVGVDWYLDGDGDGAGDALVHLRSCQRLGGEGERTPWVHNADDCDDQDPEQHPGQTWLLDGDGDGYGTVGRSLDQCGRPPAFVAAPKGVSLDACGLACDCDDTNREIRPGAAERCNEVDDDCDGIADQDDPDLGVARWYVDEDGDGYGAQGSIPTRCDTTDRVPNASDCDDDRAERNPAAAETYYDAVDDNCNAADDFDADGDGDPHPQDCDDGVPWMYHGAPELCSGVSEGCADPFSVTAELGTATFYPGILGLGDEVVDSRDGRGEAEPGRGVPEPAPLQFTPIDYTTELTSGQVVDLFASGTLLLCGDETTPAFRGGVTSVGRVDLRGVRYEQVARRTVRRPSEVVFDNTGTNLGIQILGGTVQDLRLVGSTPDYGVSCLASSGNTTLERTAIEGCVGSGRHELVDVRILDTVGPAALSIVGDVDATDLVVDGTVGGVGIYHTGDLYSSARRLLSLTGGSVSGNETGGISAFSQVVLDGVQLEDNGVYGVAAEEVLLRGGTTVAGTLIGVSATNVHCAEASLHDNAIGIDATATADLDVGCALDGDPDNLLDLRVGGADYVGEVVLPLDCPGDPTCP